MDPQKTIPNRDSASIDEFVDFEGAPGEAHAPIPRWLVWVYWLVPLFGVLLWCLFWNGSGGADGFFDRGAWSQLQRAAKTTYPWHNKVVTEPMD